MSRPEYVLAVAVIVINVVVLTAVFISVYTGAC